MKTRTKITVTLAVGIGLLAGSMGVASASPHYSDYNGRPSFKAPVSSYSHNLEWDLKAPVSSYMDGVWIMAYREDGAGRLHENKAPVSSYTDFGRVPYITDSGRTLGFSHHANIDYFHQGKTSFEAGQVRPLFKIQF